MSKSGKRLIQSAEQAYEMTMYYMICQEGYPDSFQTIQSMELDASQKQRSSAEVAYIQDNDSLPTWATVIESFEVVDGNYIFIYRSPNKVLD